jgi:DNA-binding PadR family transcriptional regulator
MYGYEITQKELNTQGELNITRGALYPALLEAEGLLDVEIEKWTTAYENIINSQETGEP